METHIERLKILKNKSMKQNYQNDLLGQSKTEIKKIWDGLWDKMVSLDPIRDANEIVEVKNRFDKCVEAYYAVDCGNHWEVKSASSIRGRYMTYKVMKES